MPSIQGSNLRLIAEALATELDGRTIVFDGDEFSVECDTHDVTELILEGDSGQQMLVTLRVVTK